MIWGGIIYSLGGDITPLAVMPSSLTGHTRVLLLWLSIQRNYKSVMPWIRGGDS